MSGEPTAAAERRGPAAGQGAGRADLEELLPSRASSVVAPAPVAHDLLERLAAAGGPPTCAHGHTWTVDTARVRVRDRRREGRGITVERDCRVCKHQAWRERVRRTRHQMKGGRLT